MRDSASIIQSIKPVLVELEEKRQLYRKRQRFHILLIFLPLLAAPIAYFFIVESLISIALFAGLWVLLSSVLYYARAATLGKNYIAQYKAVVIPRLLELIDPQLKHDATRGISRDVFVGTELFKTNPDRYSTEDLIHGTYGKTYLQLAEIDAQERKTRSDGDGGTETYYVTIFDGLLLIADFHKHFQGRTFVFPDKSEKHFGKVARMFQKMSGRRDTKLIQLEDVEFEKKFAVYTTDDVEARYLLSTAMMQRFLEMQTRFGKDLRISFKDSCLALAVPHEHPFLEPSRSVRADDETQIRNLLTEIRYFLRIVEELDLNTRIWSKE